MNKKLVIGLASTALALGVGACIIQKSIFNNGPIETEATSVTTRTVYCAIYGTWVGNHTVKINANVGDGNTWLQSDMVNTGETYENRVIYRGSFDERYGGVDALQFQLYDGDTYDWQREPIKSWTTYGTYENKIYVFGENDNDGSWVDYQTTSVSFLNSSEIDSGTLNINTSNNQYEGVFTTASDNETFKLKKVTGETTTYPVTLDDKISESVATSDGSWITIKGAGAYMVYYKDNGTIWIQEAEAYLVAYAYAGYFLTNVGCDPDGVSVPTGWSDCEDRYENLSDGVKDYIYNFNIATAEDGENDNIVRMIRRYEWAINHNPNSLSHFIVNSSDTERPLSAYYNPVSGITSSSESNASTWALAAIAGVTALASGAFFLLRRKNEE